MNEYEEWGKWSRHNPDRLGYPCQWLEMIMRDKVAVQSVSYNITDERAGQIDKAVCKLAKYSLVLYYVFALRYLDNWSLRRIAQEYLTPLEYPNGEKKVSHHIANALLCKSEGFVDCFLENT